ncbi:MAG: hypothetical protein N2043_01390 [Ignavibacterium sp.]|nr:hypothetical protein [Ignavibacterium sp.]
MSKALEKYSTVLSNLGFNVEKHGVNVLITMLSLRVKTGVASEQEVELLNLLKKDSSFFSRLSVFIRSSSFKALDTIEKMARSGKEKLTSQEFVKSYNKKFIEPNVEVVEEVSDNDVTDDVVVEKIEIIEG